MFSTQTGTNDIGLRNYMTSIYNLMLMGLLVSAWSAWFSEISGILEVFKHSKIIFAAVLFTPLLLVFAMSFLAETGSVIKLYSLYWAFVVIEGFVLSVILSRYTAGSIVLALVASAAGFAGCSLYGYVTRRNLNAIGTFLVFSLFGLIIAMIVGIFLQSRLFEVIISFAGILIFAGLTAWDTQKLKDAYSPTVDQRRIVIMGALNLYLDFLNMFLFILRITGVASKND